MPRTVEVSVVIPTRDRVRFLRTALRSALGQRDVGLEVVVVDDVSSDGTADLVAPMEDPRLRVLRNADPLGPNPSRNRGAREATGRWLAFLDDDDLWAPDKLARQLRAAEASGSDWAYAGSVNVNDRLEVIHGVPPPFPEEVMATVRRQNPIPASASNVVIRRSSFEAAGGFHEELRTCEEWDLWIRLASGGPPAWVRQPLVAYRMHPGNAILDVSALIEGARTLERLHGIRIDWGRFHRWIAQLCLRGGRRGEALRQYARAAVHGDGREVAGELTRLARRRRSRGRDGRLPPGARRADPVWEDGARGWIEDLRRHEIDAVGDAP